jgi:cytochrome c oxidase subunit 1
MHVLGLYGMTRRIYTYPKEMGWGDMNLLATVGAGIIAVSVLLFIINVVRSYRKGELADSNPWGGGTLEWSMASPPPAGNFELVPVVHGRDPMWEPVREPSSVTGLTSKHREVLITSVNDAQLDHRMWLPSSSIWPFLSALAVTVLFIGSIFTPWAVVWASIPVAIATTVWFWPKRRTAEQRVATEVQP